MAVETTPRCCAERTCQRSQPIRLSREDDGWYVLTEYSELGPNDVGEVRQRHRLPDADQQLLEEMLQYAAAVVEEKSA